MPRGGRMLSMKKLLRRVSTCAIAVIGGAGIASCSSGERAEETAVIQQGLTGDFLPTGNLVVMEVEHFTGKLAQGAHDWTSESDANASGGQALRATPDNGTNVNTGYTTGSPRLDFRVVFAQTG